MDPQNMIHEILGTNVVSESEQLETLGRNIKAERLLQGMTQEQFSRLCGISIDTITRIENASETVAVGTVVKIAEKLNVSVASLFTKHSGLSIADASEESYRLFLTNLRAILKERGITIVRLSKEAEIELPTVRNYFSGHRRPSHQNLIKIAKALHVHPADLWVDKSKPPIVKESKASEAIEAKEKIYREIIMDLLKKS